LPTSKPPDLADRAATAVNKLNHATIPGTRPGLIHPGDAYSTIASLKQLAGSLPQTFDQITAFLKNLHQDGHLRLGNGSDPPLTVTQLGDALQQAAAAAEILRSALDQAHSALGPVGYQPRATAARARTTTRPAAPAITQAHSLNSLPARPNRTR
jgi:hypothetical protein